MGALFRHAGERGRAIRLPGGHGGRPAARRPAPGAPSWKLDGRAGSGPCQTVRYEVPWSIVQPYRTEAEVPVGRRAAAYPAIGGLPLDLRAVDAMILAAAQAARPGPCRCFQRAPEWARTQTPRRGRLAAARPPTSRGSPRVLVRSLRRRRRRLGGGAPRGRRTPRPPLAGVERAGHRPLLGRAALGAGLRGAPRSPATRRSRPPTRRPQVVLAGAPTNFSWKDLKLVYTAGGRGSFDIAAIHPFSRRVLQRDQDRRPGA